MSEGPEGNHKTRGRKAGLAAEIWTRDILNTKWES